MKNLYEEINPVLNPNEISKVVVDTLISASKKSDTKKRLEAALNSTPVSAKKIKDALVPEKTTGSNSTQRPQNTKGTKGTTGTGNKSQELNPDQTNSTVSETIYNKGKNMRKKINENEQAPTLSSAGQKLETRLDKIPDLDKLLAGVKGKGNGAQVLLQIAEGLGGEKESALAMLQAAVALAQKEKSKPKTGTPPGAPLGTTIPAPLKEFVSYLFEGTEH